jgi:hypothetical protein
MRLFLFPTFVGWVLVSEAVWGDFLGPGNSLPHFPQKLNSDSHQIVFDKLGKNVQGVKILTPKR